MAQASDWRSHPQSKRWTCSLPSFRNKHIRAFVLSLDSVALGRDPEALFPRTAGRERLQLLVDAFLREVQRVGDRDHRLECDEPFSCRCRCTVGGGNRRRGDLHALRGINRKWTRRGGQCLRSSALTASASGAGAPPPPPPPPPPPHPTTRPHHPR